MLELRTNCKPSEIVKKFQAYIESRKLRVWKVCNTRFLELEHKRYPGTCQFAIDKERDVLEIEIVGANESDSRTLGSMVGALQRRFSPLLISITIIF